MFHIPDHPRPAVSTALRAPQTAINARRIWRERIVRCLPFAYYLSIFAAVAFVALVIAHITFTTLTHGVPATLDQADRYQGM